ncbi:CIS tube protein [Crocosphaera sp.]|uniref:CIS tube protein n=1 Tax=Crocosphaera sp. TaxID=2729996 RepID=UPI003F1E7AA4|nr:hypothetical protein [Crocosphaera sp.]
MTDKLEKAILIHQPRDNDKNIEFMFNPRELEFDHELILNEGKTARGDNGYPKMSYGYRKPCILTINNVLFDGYEMGDSIGGYIKNLTQAVYFAESGDAKNKRPPVYIFAWGNQRYFTCFVQRLTYRLTRFLENGTPIQAMANLTLVKVDNADNPGGTSSAIDRNQNTRW